ncbi:hypothetical protein [Paraburkholderia bonniea]|uniref:hypothetical protein n=1 Tax=Paraburkholderia bonniea TaxID=2152891 RepID=UPI001291C125|nr:hypothetical protein [Paraburkholderia bonniea]
MTKTGTITGGKQIGVPLGNATGLNQSIDPLFDPSVNPWWGIENAANQYKGAKK